MCFSAVKLIVALVTFTIGTVVAIHFKTPPVKVNPPTAKIEQRTTHICTSFKLRRTEYSVSDDSGVKVDDKKSSNLQTTANKIDY